MCVAAQATKSLAFDLANSLTSELQYATNLFKGSRAAVEKTEPKFKDTSLSILKMAECPVDLLAH